MTPQMKTPGSNRAVEAARHFHTHITKPTLEIQKDFLELIDLIYTVSDRLDVLFLRYKKAGAK